MYFRTNLTNDVVSPIAMNWLTTLLTQTEGLGGYNNKGYIPNGYDKGILISTGMGDKYDTILTNVPYLCFNKYNPSIVYESIREIGGSPMYFVQDESTRMVTTAYVNQLTFGQRILGKTRSLICYDGLVVNKLDGVYYQTVSIPMQNYVLQLIKTIDPVKPFHNTEENALYELDQMLTLNSIVEINFMFEPCVVRFPEFDLSSQKLVDRNFENHIDFEEPTHLFSVCRFTCAPTSKTYVPTDTCDTFYVDGQEFMFVLKSNTGVELCSGRAQFPEETRYNLRPRKRKTDGSASKDSPAKRFCCIG